MTTYDERTQRDIFAEPGTANTEPYGRTWDDPGGPMVQPPDSWEVNRRVRAELHALRDRPALRQVVETAGRRASDRLAAEAQARRDMAESSADMSAAGPRESPWLTARPGPEDRRRELRTAALPRDGDFPGTGVDRDAADHRRWREHFADHYGVADPDADWWIDDHDDVHDLIPEQRQEHTL